MPFVGKHIVGMLQQTGFSTACIEDCGTVMGAIQVEGGCYGLYEKVDYVTTESMEGFD